MQNLKNEDEDEEKIIDYTRLYKKNVETKCKTVIHAGGAGSSKTYSWIQFIIFERLLKYENLEICLLRKTRQSNKLSVYKDFIRLLREYDLYSEKNHNMSDLVYTIPETKSYIWFGGLDQKSRIKSTQWHDICMEEANEFSKEDYLFLKTRLYRGDIKGLYRPRLWLLFNPEDCWVFDYEGKEDVDFIYSNYRDNPFANQEYIDTLESLKDEDITYYKIYTLGQRAKPKNVIFKPDIVDTIYPLEFEETIYGLDFGYNHQSALLQLDFKDNEIYQTELIYQTKLTNSDLIELMKEKIPESNRERNIYGDSAEPDRIKEIFDAGFNIKSSAKGKNSVKDSIDFCKRYKFHTKESNVNLNKERSMYKWKEDKNGNILDEPVKFKDHLMSCRRYGIYTHLKDGGGDQQIRFL